MKLTQEQENLILELNALGVPKTKIMEKAHCSRTAIYNCIQRSKNPKIDPMIGQRFGSLTVIERADKNTELVSRCIRYVCQCDCGSIIEVNGNSLRTGHTKSCGCSRKNINYVDLTNQHYGKLTALYIVGTTKDRRKIWHCKCECGNECDVPANLLISGATKSCGCLHSYKEYKINKILTDLGVNFKREYTFSNLRGVSKPLRFDFAIFNNDNELLALIEYQGIQHTDINNNWHNSQLIESDQKKIQYCQMHQIDLYHFDKTTDLETTIKELLLKYGY